MCKEDFCANCNLEIHQNEDIFGNWGNECCNCDHYSGDDDDLMSIFNMAEIWFYNDKDED